MLSASSCSHGTCRGGSCTVTLAEQLQWVMPEYWEPIALSSDPTRTWGAEATTGGDLAGAI